MNQHFRKLKFSYWNADSIPDKIHELYNFLTVEKVDVCCVSETCLPPNYRLPSHKDYRFEHLSRQADQSRASGGVGIFIRRSLKYELLKIPSTKVIECMGIKLFTQRGNLEIFSAYLPGGSERQKIREHYRNDLRSLTHRSGDFLVLGDLNSRHRSWNCASSNLAGKILFEEHQTGMFQLFHPSSPTRYSYGATGNPSTIDLTLTNCRYNLSDLETHESASTIHHDVSFSMDLEGEVQETQARRISVLESKLGSVQADRPSEARWRY